MSYEWVPIDCGKDHEMQDPIIVPNKPYWFQDSIARALSTNRRRFHNLQIALVTFVAWKFRYWTFKESFTEGNYEPQNGPQLIEDLHRRQKPRSVSKFKIEASILFYQFNSSTQCLTYSPIQQLTYNHSQGFISGQRISKPTLSQV